MVLLGVPKADLPPVKPPPPKCRPMGGSMAQPAKSLAPRISDLSATLASKSSEEGKVKGACAELALLASRSVSACMAVADAEIEKPLSQVLIKQSDPATQCWVMSILSNCAALPHSRERQTVAIPALCKLVQSTVPEVQHAAALHLATLSHSANVQLAFKENQRALRCLHAIEGKKSMSLSLPGKQTLQNEASQYARWALRTAQGRNIKPAYVPKTDEELEYEGSVAIQARVRSSFVASQYRKEMAQRKSAAIILQSGYRGHKGRDEIAKEMLIQGPAAALLQGVMRGRRERKEAAKQRASAAKVQARYRGNQARSNLPGRDPIDLTDGEVPPAEEEQGYRMPIEIACSDGVLSMPLLVGGEEDPGMMTLKIKVSDGPPLSFDMIY